jgi:hypothetical protein
MIFKDEILSQFDVYWAKGAVNKPTCQSKATTAFKLILAYLDDDEVHFLELARKNHVETDVSRSEFDETCRRVRLALESRLSDEI